MGANDGRTDDRRGRSGSADNRAWRRPPMAAAPRGATEPTPEPTGERGMACPGGSASSTSAQTPSVSSSTTCRPACRSRSSTKRRSARSAPASGRRSAQSEGRRRGIAQLAPFHPAGPSDGRRPPGDGGDGGGARRQRRPRLRRSRRARVWPRRPRSIRAPRKRGSPRSACSTACRPPTACWAISAAAASIW